MKSSEMAKTNNDKNENSLDKDFLELMSSLKYASLKFTGSQIQFLQHFWRNLPETQREVIFKNSEFLNILTSNLNENYPHSLLEILSEIAKHKNLGFKVISEEILATSKFVVGSIQPEPKGELEFLKPKPVILSTPVMNNEGNLCARSLILAAFEQYKSTFEQYKDKDVEVSEMEDMSQKSKSNIGIMFFNKFKKGVLDLVHSVSGDSSPEIKVQAINALVTYLKNPIWDNQKIIQNNYNDYIKPLMEEGSKTKFLCDIARVIYDDNIGRIFRVMDREKENLKNPTQNTISSQK